MRATILELIQSIPPSDVQEEESIQFVMDWISSGADIYRRISPAIPNIHLASYFVPYDREKKQILLVDHIKAELWLPPGGHVEPEEHPKDCAIREAKEELGIEAQFLTSDPLFLSLLEVTHKNLKHTDVSLWFVLDVKTTDDLNYDQSEFHQIRWFPIDDLPYPLTDPHMQRFVWKLQNSVLLFPQNFIKIKKAGNGLK
jgi:8-oxo-dGTP pyrophosphatase MutT (NUDIX family)